MRLQQVEIDAQTRSAQFVLQGIPYGVYAVSVFHDENMNGKLDKNFVGAPKEGYGASTIREREWGHRHFVRPNFRWTRSEESIEIKPIY